MSIKIKEIQGNTEGFLPYLGPIIKHFRARKANAQLDESQFTADEVLVKPGYNIHCQGDMVPPFLHEGTIEARLKYSSTPTDVNTAYSELKKVNEQTGYDFTSDVNIKPYGLQVFDGQWRLIDTGSCHYIGDNKTEKDVVLGIHFPGKLETDKERQRILSLVDKLSEPQLESDGNYWTHYDGGGTGGKTPTIVVQKTFENFDEQEVMDVYRELKQFEKLDYRSHTGHNMRMGINLRVKNTPEQQIFISYLFPKIESSFPLPF